MPYIKTLIVAFDSWRKIIGDLQERLRRERQKLTSFFVIMAHAACQGFRERSLWMRPGNQVWFEMEVAQFDEQQWYENC